VPEVSEQAAAGSTRPFPTAILASGSGTNLQAVLERARAGVLPLEIRLVVSDRAGAFAIERAQRAGVPSRVLPYQAATQTRGEYARALAAEVRRSGARLVLLLGWMHVLAPEFLTAGFDGVLNLHPAYLPDDPAADHVTLPDGTVSAVYRGAHALRDALRAGAPTTGATLIEITPAVDRGPVLARRAFALRADDTEESALARLHPVEQDVVQEGVLKWLAMHDRARAQERGTTS
jgi:phosphoribosylglycinamide formyltransferase 1